MRKEERRAAIIDEAIRIIGDQGYRGFSINDLAKRCGLTTAGLLHHFGSKEGLLIALLDERDRRDEQAISGRLELRRGQSLTREQVLMVLHAIVRQNATQPHLVRLYTMLRAEALTRDHPARQYFLDREQGTTGRSSARSSLPMSPTPPDRQAANGDHARAGGAVAARRMQLRPRRGVGQGGGQAAPLADDRLPTIPPAGRPSRTITPR